MSAIPETPDPQELAAAREREADEMQRRSEKLEGEVSDAREDWASKRSDESVPGAPAPDEGAGTGR